MKKETNKKFLKYSLFAFANCIVAIILINLVGPNFVLTILFNANFVVFGFLFFILGLFPRLNSFLHPNHEDSLKNPGYAALCSLGLYIKN